MPRHPSNADRISRAAAEAEAATQEKTVRKATAAKVPGKAPSKPRAPAAPKPRPRLKVVWAVGRPGLEPVKVYPYAEKETADAESARRGGDFRVVPMKVPMV